MKVDGLKKHKLVYLGSPYSKFAKGIEKAFQDIAEIAAIMLQIGVKVYSPICHCHPIAMYGNIDPMDHKFWLKLDETMMDVCDALVVVKMESWTKSVGLALELEVFRKAGKPTYFLDPVTLELT